VGSGSEAQRWRGPASRLGLNEINFSFSFINKQPQNSHFKHFPKVFSRWDKNKSFQHFELYEMEVKS
jgi:hypothetical protein